MKRLCHRIMYFVYAAVLLTAGSHLSGSELRWTHFGLRPLAMGNAYVAVADDFNALFYNPAGLARVKEWSGEFLNPYIELSHATGSFASDASKLFAGSAGDTEAVLDLIEKNTGKVQHLALGMSPHLIFQNFGFGLGVQIAGNFVFHRDPSIEIDMGPDVVLPISLAKSFFENRLSVGVGIKFRLRGGINSDFGIEDLQALNSNSDSAGDTNQAKLEDYVTGGSGVGGDFGILFTPTEPMEPTLGISITDIGATTFEKFDVSGEAALGTPAIVLPSVNVGLSAKPVKTAGTYVLTSIDVHAINQPVSFSKKLNLGIEWGYGDLFKVQGGLHQGYLTGGLQLDIGLLNIRLATYGEELGPTAGSIEDRRYVMQFKLLI